MKTRPDYLDALMLAFDRGMLATPAGKENWLFLNANPLPSKEPEWKNVLRCEQSFRPVFNSLTDAGHQCYPDIDLQSVSNGAMILASRVRKLNETNITRAWNACSAGSLIIVAGDKKSGIQSLRKWVAARTGILDSFSKFHGLVFWFRKTGENWPIQKQPKHANGYQTDTGMFSASGPDKGSVLLARHFDNRLRGNIADFGAGWGYLSAEVLTASDRVQKLDLYEAEWQALELARKNVRAEIPLSFNWIDIRAEFSKKPYDWVIMNPPFHASLSSGRAAEPEIGKNFIAIAASTLVEGGRLLMVANRTLPYEQVLKHGFRTFRMLADESGYKVFEAMR